MSSFQIAIDGPVAAGKGTVAKLVAKRLGFLYVDTGAMYRVAALISKKNNIDWSDETGVAQLVRTTDIVMRNPQDEEMDGRLSTVIVNGEDVSWAIRTEEVSLGSSIVAKLPQVRHVLVEKQQLIAETQNVVMEGRDITFRVLPEAQIKIYLTASETSRAERRHQELLTRGEDVTFDQVLADLKNRDNEDMNRTTDPLHIVSDAWVIDTTNLSIEDVVGMIERKVGELTHD